MDLLKTDLSKLSSQELLEAANLFQQNYKILLESNKNSEKTIAKLVKELENLKQTKLDIKTSNVILKNLIFGKKSEKLKLPDKQGVEESELSERTPSEEKREEKHAGLETEVIKNEFVILPVCSKCESTLKEMKDQYEKTTEITVVERRYKKRIHLRQKYCCPQCHEEIVTAPGPLKLKKGGEYSPEFAIQVAMDKYADHIPLHRQSIIMNRQGLRVKPVTLWNQLEHLADLLHPLYKGIHKAILTEHVLHSDETRWPLLRDGGKSWWVWGLRTQKGCFYRIHESRSGKVPKNLLQDFKGVLLVDAYGGYNQITLEDGIQKAYCMAHMRRKFYEIKEIYPQETEPILKSISKLYGAEKMCASFDERLKIRQAVSVNLMADLKKQIESTLVKTLPRSRLAKACSYALNHWEGLTLFLEDGEIDLDNNKAENSLRNPVLGRKNHLGSKSGVGALVTSIFYTIIETCRVNNVEPQAYLKYIIPLLLQKEVVPLPHEWHHTAD